MEKSKTKRQRGEAWDPGLEWAEWAKGMEPDELTATIHSWEVRHHSRTTAPAGHSTQTILGGHGRAKAGYEPAEPVVLSGGCSGSSLVLRGQCWCARTSMKSRRFCCALFGAARRR
jgi:hypothetical protein